MRKKKKKAKKAKKAKVEDGNGEHLPIEPPDEMTMEELAAEMATEAEAAALASPRIPPSRDLALTQLEVWAHHAKELFTLLRAYDGELERLNSLVDTLRSILAVGGNPRMIQDRLQTQLKTFAFPQNFNEQWAALVGQRLGIPAEEVTKKFLQRGA